jgi:hypothetical protein
MFVMGLGCCCGDCPNDQKYHRCRSYCCHNNRDDGRLGKMPCCVVVNGQEGSSGGGASLSDLFFSRDNLGTIGFNACAIGDPFSNAYPRDIWLWFRGDDYYFSGCDAPCYWWSVAGCDNDREILDPSCDSIRGDFSSDRLTENLSYSVVLLNRGRRPDPACNWTQPTPGASFVPSDECFLEPRIVPLQLLIFVNTQDWWISRGFPVDPTDDTFGSSGYTAIYRVTVGTIASTIDCDILLGQTFVAKRVPNFEFKCTECCPNFGKAVGPDEPAPDPGEPIDLCVETYEWQESPYLGYSDCLPEELVVTFPHDDGTNSRCQIGDIAIRSRNCSFCIHEEHVFRNPNCEPVEYATYPRQMKILLNGVKGYPDDIGPPLGEHFCDDCGKINGTYILHGGCLGYTYQGTFDKLDSDWILANNDTDPRQHCCCHDASGDITACVPAEIILDLGPTGAAGVTRGVVATVTIKDSNGNRTQFFTKTPANGLSAPLDCQKDLNFAKESMELAFDDIPGCDFSNAEISVSNVGKVSHVGCLPAGALVLTGSILDLGAVEFPDCVFSEPCYHCSEGCAGDESSSGTLNYQGSGIDDIFKGGWGLLGNGCRWNGERIGPLGTVQYVSVKLQSLRNWRTESCGARLTFEFNDTHNQFLRHSASFPFPGIEINHPPPFGGNFSEELTINTSQWEPCGVCKVGCEGEIIGRVINLDTEEVITQATLNVFFDQQGIWQ